MGDRGAGRGPKSGLNGSEVVLCPNRARELKKVCEPHEECTDFWPELTNYHKLLTMLQTSDFRAQGQWVLSDFTKPPRLCRKFKTAALVQKHGV